jgi:dolichol kinase
MKKKDNRKNLLKTQYFSENDDNNILEVKRQLFHLCLGLIITFGVYFLRPKFGPFFIIIPLIIALIFMLFIPRVAPDLKVSNHLLYHFERNHNIIAFPFKGAFWYGLGIIFPIFFLELEIACAIIIVVSVGDALSTLVGKFYGKYKVKEKSIEGFLAFVLFSFLGAAIFVDPFLAGIFALLGGLIELFLTMFDDNFLIPVILTFLYLIF